MHPHARPRTQTLPPRRTRAQRCGAAAVERDGGLKRNAPLAARWVLVLVSTGLKLHHNWHEARALAVGCELNLLAGGALLGGLATQVCLFLPPVGRGWCPADEAGRQPPEAAAAAARALGRVGGEGQVRLPAWRSTRGAGCAAAAAAGPLGLLRLACCVGRVAAAGCADAAALAKLDVS